MTAQTQSFLQGETVDERYCLGRYLGGTDHSAVFLTQFGEIHPRNAAIKLLPARRGSAELQLSRWRLAANLAHPRLLRILDMGRCELGSTSMLYVVTELASENLAEIIPERPLTADEGREMLAPILDALTVIHSRGFVHGRIKPSNIVVVAEEIKLSSDSICRLSEPVENAGHASIYDPPEGTRNGASTAGDIWSLGVTIVEALSQETLSWNPAERREPLIPESVPPPFAEFARHCLRRDPKNRWTAANIRARLPRARTQAADRAPEPPPERTEEQPAPRPTVQEPELAPKPPDHEVVQAAAVPSVSQSTASAATAQLAATAKAFANWLGSAVAACAGYARQVWRRLEAVEWRRYASVTSQFVVAVSHRALAACRRIPIDALRRHAVAQWRRYALGAGAIVAVVALIFLGSKLGRHSARPTAETASVSTPARSTAKSSRNEPASAKPVRRASQPPTRPRTEQNESAKQQPIIPPPAAAAVTAPPSVPPPVSSAANSLPGRVIHQAMPDVPKKASDTIWGTVRVGVRVNVDPAGNVTAASLESAGPSRYFARLSLDAARDWKFAPPQINGAAVDSAWILNFGYQKDGASVRPSQVKP